MTSRFYKLDELGSEIARIAIPAALALAADPLASLVDTAFIGQLGLLAFLAFRSLVESSGTLLLPEHINQIQGFIRIMQIFCEILYFIFSTKLIFQKPPFIFIRCKSLEPSLRIWLH